MQTKSAAQPAPQLSPLKNALANIALVMVSSAITYLILELIFFRL